MFKGKEEKGVVDSLFKGDGVHVLMERKTRIPNTKYVSFIEKQAQRTAQAYKDLEYHKEDGKTCKVKSVIFAESIAEAAIEHFVAKGFYVLCGADMRLLKPVSA